MKLFTAYSNAVDREPSTPALANLDGHIFGMLVSFFSSGTFTFVPD